LGICIFFIGLFSKNEYFSTLKKLKWANTMIHSPHYPKYSNFPIILGNPHPLLLSFAQISPLFSLLWAILSTFLLLCPIQSTFSSSWGNSLHFCSPLPKSKKLLKQRRKANTPSFFSITL